MSATRYRVPPSLFRREGNAKWRPVVADVLQASLQIESGQSSRKARTSRFGIEHTIDRTDTSGRSPHSRPSVGQHSDGIPGVGVRRAVPQRDDDPGMCVAGKDAVSRDAAAGPALPAG